MDAGSDSDASMFDDPNPGLRSKNKGKQKAADGKKDKVKDRAKEVRHNVVFHSADGLTHPMFGILASLRLGGDLHSLMGCCPRR